MWTLAFVLGGLSLPGQPRTEAAILNPLAHPSDVAAPLMSPIPHGPAASMLPRREMAAICQTPVNWCIIPGPPSWGYSCYCVFGGIVYNGVTNG
jgi:hypothetical protein